MTLALNLAGQKFGRLTVLHRGENDKHGKSQWLCKCDCGTEVLVIGSNLQKGNSESCGCLHRENVGNFFRKHGLHETKIYRVYSAAKERCTNPNNKNYKDYGARGIKFRFSSVTQFIKELGPQPSKKHTVDRIDSDGNYEPGNIRWATMKQQRINRRKPNARIS